MKQKLFHQKVKELQELFKKESLDKLKDISQDDIKYDIKDEIKNKDYDLVKDIQAVELDIDKELENYKKKNLNRNSQRVSGLVYLLSKATK